MTGMRLDSSGTAPFTECEQVSDRNELTVDAASDTRTANHDLPHPAPRSAQRCRKLANIFYGDVHVGTIRKVEGLPSQWEWRCGFYPGSEPGEYRSGSADQFDQAV